MIAPADGSIPTSDGTGTVEYSNDRVPLERGTSSTPPFTVTAPSFLDIMNAQTVYALSDRIITPEPKAVSGNASSTLGTVSGLMPNTEYFVYFVLQGTGQMHSDVQIVKFKTAKESNPILSLSSYSRDVTLNIENRIPSDVTWALVQYARVGALTTSLLTQGLNTPLSGLMDSSVDNSVKTQYGSTKIIDAMNTMVTEDYSTLGSVFDLYASAVCKAEVASIIKAGAAGANAIIIEGGSLTLGSGRTPVYTGRVTTTKVEGETQYAFLAMAESTTGAGVGYSAIYPVRNQSTTPPMVTTVSNSLGLSGTGYITGDITLVFDQDLYFNGGAVAVDRASVNAANRPSTSISVADNSFLLSASTGITPTLDDRTLGTATGVILLHVNMAAGSSTSGIVTFARGISNEDGIASGDNLIIQVNYSEASNSISLIVSDWNDTKTFTIPTGISVRSISINPVSATIGIGGSGLQLNATVTPANATDQRVTWTSSNTTIATVTNDGLVTGLKAGTATITATTVDGGYTARCTVTVSGTSVSRVTFSTNTLSMSGSQTGTLNWTVSPTNAGDKSVQLEYVQMENGVWVTDNTTDTPPAITNVNTESGTATITTTETTTTNGTWNLRVMTNDGNKSDIMTITVTGCQGAHT